MNLIFLTENQHLIDEINRVIDDWNDPSPTLTVSTSGSTGNPKKIRLEKKMMEVSAQMTGNFLGLKQGDSALYCLSPETIGGKMMIIRALVIGMNLTIVDVNSTPLDKTDAYFNFAAMVPLQAEGCLKQSKLNRIEKLIIGGGPISGHLWASISETNCHAFQTYGMTETISHVAMREISKSSESYTALPGVSFTIKEGCLVVQAPQIGVLNLETNDCVELRNNQQFYWLGRNDFVINSGGIKLHPEQIEKSLEDLINQPFFSTGLPDDTLGTKHVMFLESTKQLDLSKLDFSQHLDKFSIPKEIYYFETFEYTASGKINRIETAKNLKNAKKQVL